MGGKCENDGRRGGEDSCDDDDDEEVGRIGIKI